MATVPIDDETTRKSYTATAGQTSFAYTWWIKEDDHLDVFVNGTLRSLGGGADYTVSTNQDPNGGNVVFNSGLNSGDVVVISYNPDIERLTEFQTSGDFKASDLNLELTYLVSLSQFIDTQLGRKIGLSTTDVGSIDPQLPEIKANKIVLTNAAGDGFALSTNDFTDIEDDLATLAPISSDITTAAGVSSDIATLADIEDGTEATDAIQTVAGISTDVVEAAEILDGVLAFTFDDSTSMADPGVGEVRFNNASLGSVSEIAFDAQTAQSGNPDVSDFLASWDDSTNPVTGQLKLTKGGAPDVFAVYNVSAVSDNSGWLQVSVSHVQSNGSLSDGETLYVSFARAGDAGSSFSSSDITGQPSAVLGLTDKIAFADASDGDNLKVDDIQGILDLVAAANTPLGTLAEQDTVGTSDIDDDAVTLAKLAGGTARKRFGIDASGNPAHVDNIESTTTKSLSGTEVTFTGLDPGIQRITVEIIDASFSASDSALFQFETSSGWITSGYDSKANDLDGTGGSTTATSGFLLTILSNATITMYSKLIIDRMDAHTWKAFGGGHRSGAGFVVLGEVTLANEIISARTLLNGANSYDAGSIQLKIEK